MKTLRSFEILDLLKEKRRCSLEALRERFGVSSATIHRDVAELVGRGVARRVRGGIAFVDGSGAADAATHSFRERAALNRTAKERIARQAAALVEEGDILFLDSSTTVACLAEALVEKPFANLTVVTNGVAVCDVFPRFPSHYVLLALGGAYDPRLNAFLGETALEQLSRLSLTKAFVSAIGFDEHHATTNHENQAQLLHRVLQMAPRRYLLADKSKSGRTGLYKLAPLAAFDAVVTS